MKKTLLAIAVVALGLPLLVGLARPAAADGCLDGLKPALMAGGFSGSVDCHRDRLSITKVGQVRAEGRTFTIYAYQYRLASVCPECAIHGGQRVIFMDGDRYLGQYRADFAKVEVRDGVLVFTALDEDPVAVLVTQDGPPGELLVHGDLLEFFR